MAALMSKLRASSYGVESPMLRLPALLYGRESPLIALSAIKDLFISYNHNNQYVNRMYFSGYSAIDTVYPANISNQTYFRI